MTDIRFIKGDARHLPIEDESVQCIVTSPPYWGLRKYVGEQDLIWYPEKRTQADPFICQEEGHLWTERARALHTGTNAGEKQVSNRGAFHNDAVTVDGMCARCGAWRGAFGLEPRIEMYVQHTIEILRELRRVLRPDGVLFWNIGDSYAAAKGFSGDLKPSDMQSSNRGSLRGPNVRPPNRNGMSGLKPKDLCLIPARVAIAAQQDGWWVRSMILWVKPNPMPESCKDRPTDSYEHIIMLTKSARYFWDFDAVQEPCSGTAHPRGDGVNPKCVPVSTGWDSSRGDGGHGKFHKEGRNSRIHQDQDPRHPAERKNKQNESFSAVVNQLVESRNIRNVWSFGTQGYAEAHFATFPEELPRRCILAATKVGDTVLDPFAGSGTVGRVAIELNRKAILNDLAYHDLSEKRTRNVQRQLI